MGMSGLAAIESVSDACDKNFMRCCNLLIRVLADVQKSINSAKMHVFLFLYLLRSIVPGIEG